VHLLKKRRDHVATKKPSYLVEKWRQEYQKNSWERKQQEEGQSDQEI